MTLARVQPYEGIIIGIHKAGVATTITVRKAFQGYGVERFDVRGWHADRVLGRGRYGVAVLLTSQAHADRCVGKRIGTAGMSEAELRVLEPAARPRSRRSAARRHGGSLETVAT